MMFDIWQALCYVLHLERTTHNIKRASEEISKSCHWFTHVKRHQNAANWQIQDHHPCNPCQPGGGGGWVCLCINVVGSEWHLWLWELQHRAWWVVTLVRRRLATQRCRANVGQLAMVLDTPLFAVQHLLQLLPVWYHTQHRGHLHTHRHTQTYTDRQDMTYTHIRAWQLRYRDKAYRLLMR